MGKQDIQPLKGWKETTWSSLVGQGDACYCESQWSGAPRRCRSKFILVHGSRCMAELDKHPVSKTSALQSTADNFITDMRINVALCSLNTAEHAV